MSDDLIGDLQQFLDGGGEPDEPDAPTIPAYMQFTAESGTLTIAGGQHVAVTQIHGTQLGQIVSIKLLLPPGYDMTIFSPAYRPRMESWQITLRTEQITVSGEFVAATYGDVPHGGTACALEGNGQVTHNNPASQ